MTQRNALHGLLLASSFTITIIGGGLADRALAQPQLSPGDKAAALQLQIKPFLEAHCRQPEAIPAPPLPSVATIDNDTDPDFYVDLDPASLTAAGCDVQSSRLQWLSTQDYRLRASPAPIANDKASSKPAAVEATVATPAKPGPAVESDLASAPPPKTVAAATSEGKPDKEAPGAPRQVNVLLLCEIFGALALAIGAVVCFVRSVTYSFNRYQYRVILNWNTLIWPTAACSIYLAWVVCFSQNVHITAGTGLTIFGAGLMLLAVVRNIRRTSLLFGLWISFLQILAAAPALAVALYLSLQLMGFQERHGAHRS